MIKMYNEAEDDISMNVQVGPKEEIDAEMKTSPVDIAKMNPDTVIVAGKVNDEGVNEFYVDANDVISLAELNESNFINALNDIIAANENTDISAQNLFVVMNESNIDMVKELENHGVNCIRFVSEADDISMDVQVGPNDDEIRVSEDPQEANPVDAVKRQYDNVIVAKQGDEFFTDVEDVQKCAELNCESVLDTLNGIIAANESTGMTAQNLVVVFSEADELTDHLYESGVVLMESLSDLKAKHKEKKEAKKSRNKVVSAASGVINGFFAR